LIKLAGNSENVHERFLAASISVDPRFGKPTLNFLILGESFFERFQTKNKPVASILILLCLFEVV
jgi:hypothetical protein